MNASEKKYGVAAVVLLALAACLPLIDTGYWLSLGITIAMYTVLATSWALFSGPTHYIALSTAAFFGIGMYVVGGGVGSVHMAVLVILAGGLGALVSLLIGVSTLRLSGVYFVIFTLGLTELVRELVSYGQTQLGSTSGLYVLTDITESMIYWELLALAAIVYLVGWRIRRSRLGFALRIIGNDETVALHSGIDTARAKVVLFVVSGTFAAVTGAIVAPRWTYVEPIIAFSPMISFQVVIMALLGGVNRLWGPLVGVIPFALVWDLISANFPNQTTLLLGVAFLLVVYVIPRGFAGLIEDGIRRVRGGRS